MKNRFQFLFLFLVFSTLLFSYEYQHLETEGQSIHVLEIDPSQYEMKLVHALDDGIGRETVLSLSERYGAVAAINGGFFSPKGISQGILKIEDHWYALPQKPRAALGWCKKDQKPLIGALLGAIRIEGEKTSFFIDGLNRERKEGEVILYSPAFHRTTLTSHKGIEILLRDNKVFTIKQGGSSPIPLDGWVLSIDEKNSLCSYPPFRLGEKVAISILLLPQFSEEPGEGEWKKADYIVGGTPLLMQKNEKVTNFVREQVKDSFLFQRHSRTAVGLLPNGHWLFVVVEGKQQKVEGLTMDELACLMQKLHCSDALNLDGGGSATLVIDGKVMNHLEEEDEIIQLHEERAVADAILIFKKEP